MKGLMIVEGGGDNKQKDFSYGDIIDLLIKAQKLRYTEPKLDLACYIDPRIIEDPQIHRILAACYDRIVHSDDDLTGSDVVKFSTFSNNNSFDEDFEYYQIKQQLGNVLTNHFMFSEHDIEIKQRGGFDFRKNKVKFKTTSDPKAKVVSELYNIPLDTITTDQLKYYHILPKKRFSSFEVSPMFDNIVEYDYLSPLIKLSDYHSPDNYYSKLLKRNEVQLNNASDKRLRLNLVDDIDPSDRDLIMLQYAKCRKNLFAVTLWRPAMPGLDSLVEFLEKNGEIYYIKTINLSRNALKNLMFAYYDEFSYEEALVFIGKKLDYVDVTDDNNPVVFILFDNTLSKKISGQGASFKQELRNLIIESSGVDKTRDRGNDMIHINDYFYQTIEYSEILLNDNTIRFLDKQETSNYTSSDFSFVESNLKMQTLRSVTYKNMSLLEMDRMIIVGGIIFYAYGVRAFNDIDAGHIDIFPNESKHLIDIISRYFSNDSTKFYFLDSGVSEDGSVMWDESWRTKDASIYEFLQISDYKDFVLDPKNYMYFQGIKMAVLEYEMLRKLFRNRTQDHVDFMMINLLDPRIIEDFVVLKDVGSNTNTSPYFIITDRYANVAGSFKDRIPEEKVKILKRRYTPDQIRLVQEDPRFKHFFGSSYIVPKS